MSSTRPIPIGSSGSQRGSPVTRSPNGAAMVSHSLPADMHHVHLSRFMTNTSGTRSGELQPPRAPRVGSMPEPNFLQLDNMPDLALGPPAETIEEDSPPARVPAVIQFASSCPGDIGFLRRNPARGSWTPTLDPYLAEHDDFDLSKSPALAAMSFNARGAAETQPSRQYYASDESSSNAVSAELLERLSITSEEGEEPANRDERYRMPGYDMQMPVDQRRRSERRGSYGNVSDTGDTGIFEFDDQ
ncbi:uncharacterized protein PITG_05797 [Phytophthora infestans T30-4]|uniref:Uncharacterized protein n=1 Tax=Phytophthora infestans (strain T30-4) TaxID=403677 RepID=D0N5Q0_PHYIT|nr:uncharacterized protein PITG_05797 [Phytophthora infestans T30-4]EEY70391.1 conserved hypothetical protein [Phytophthora infestans T30-4]|eukprot:XP_002998045.1 conserved hypothetical protein [Phytophthora infestans T30-4]